MARYQNILETIGNTPVVRLNKLAPPGVNVPSGVSRLTESPTVTRNFAARSFPIRMPGASSSVPSRRSLRRPDRKAVPRSVT